MTFKNAFALSLGASLGATAFLYYNNNTFETTKYNLKKGLEKPFKILQISDLHDNHFGKDNKRLLSACSKCSPDIIVITGDSFTTGGKKLLPTLNFIHKLCQISPTFAILGNHEQRCGMSNLMSACFEDAGAALLNNRLWEGVINGQKVNILGLCEQQGISRKSYLMAQSGRLKYEDHRKEVKDLSQKDGIRILLSHYPENFALIDELSYCNYPFDVMFAGHAHGGQVKLPRIGPLFSPGQGIFPQFYDGVYQSRVSTLVVSRGLGNSVPLTRINNRPQLVLTTLF